MYIWAIEMFTEITEALGFKTIRETLKTRKNGILIKNHSLIVDAPDAWQMSEQNVELSLKYQNFSQNRFSREKSKITVTKCATFYVS